MFKRIYGWHQPKLPSRRFPQAKLQTFPALPASGSLIETGFLPPIWDQGDTGSCTGHGSTRGIEFVRAKQGLPYVDFSRLFPYYNARVAEGDPGQDSGASVGDAIVAHQTYGDCPYADLPTDPTLVTVKPSAAAYADAISHKALTATQVLGSTSASFEYHFKHCLVVLGLPVIFGFTVYESFESDAVASSGIVPMPGANETVEGGHCVAATAYDDATGLVTCDNSWGTSWGQKGRFQIPYAYIFDSSMASDFHAIMMES
jgi:C1A family cysteine protease